jgi:hypothetical protein
MTMDALTPQRPALFSAYSVEKEEETTTALLLDGALGDMVAVSTQCTQRADIKSAEGTWHTVTRADHHDLWWSAEADYDSEWCFLSKRRRRRSRRSGASSSFGEGRIVVAERGDGGERGGVIKQEFL